MPLARTASALLVVSMLALACGGSFLSGREKSDFEAIQPWLIEHAPVPTTTAVRLPYSLDLEHPGVALDEQQLREAWRRALTNEGFSCTAALLCARDGLDLAVEVSVDPAGRSGTTTVTEAGP